MPGFEDLACARLQIQVKSRNVAIITIVTGIVDMVSCTQRSVSRSEDEALQLATSVLHLQPSTFDFVVASGVVWRRNGALYYGNQIQVCLRLKPQA
jgi:hypothetical protein